MQELQDKVSWAKNSDGDLMSVGREIVDFHGEMVLLENYSALNYTGIFLSLLYKPVHELRFHFLHKIVSTYNCL